jgi:hypothetical protein
MRLFVQYASGFSAQPFSWSVQVSETGGQIELVWKTSSSPPATEHRQQVQTLPMWCMEAMFTLGDIDFTALPPAAKWSVGLDDAPTLALRSKTSTRNFRSSTRPSCGPRCQPPRRLRCNNCLPFSSPSHANFISARPKLQ